MANDNVTAGTQSGSGPIFATDQKTGTLEHYPKNKIAWGPDDTFNDVQLTSAFPVQPGTGATWVLGAGSSAIGSVTVTGTVAVSNSALTSILADYNADAAIHVLASNSGTFATQAAQSGTWTVQPGNTANTTAWLVNNAPVTTGGLTPYTAISAATNNATSVKNSAGQLYNVTGFNNSTNIAYLKFYDKASAPFPATDTVKQSYMLPASSGFTINIDKGLAFGTGIAFALVNGVSNTDNTSVAASAYVVNIGYK